MKFLLSFFYDLIYRLIASFKSSKSNNIAIVRLDAIGDYLLFRNFLKVIKESPMYFKYNIYFIGNKYCLELYELFDKDTITGFIPIDLSKLTDNRSIYKLSLLIRLKSYRFKSIINPVHSRFYPYDKFLKDINCPELIGSTGDNIRNSQVKFEHSSRFYDKLIPLNEDIKFEFNRNKDFVGKLLNANLKSVEFKIESESKIIRENIILISISAGEKSRVWSVQNFIQLIKFILRDFPEFKILLTGIELDVANSKKIESAIKQNIYNLVGRTDFKETIKVLKNVKFAITMDTSILHLCNALKVPNICISNGQHFMRFHPYPTEIFEKSMVFYPSNDFYKSVNYESLYSIFKINSTLQIDDINPDIVYSFLKNEINNYNS